MIAPPYLRALLVSFLFAIQVTYGQTQQTPLEIIGEPFLQPQSFAQSPGKIRALVVGVSRYRELPKEAQLGYADADARAFYDFLTSPTGAGADTANVRLLLNERATAAEIYAGLGWLMNCDRNDRVIIFFAGHGDVETVTVRQRGFLLAHDSPRAGYQAGGTVKVMDIQDYLETLVAKKANVLLITDACRAGKLAGGEQGQSQTTAALQEQWSGIVKVLSSQPGEKSLEGETWGGGHGVFTYHLIGGLKGLADSNGDGAVTLRELNLFLSNEVPAATQEKQNPIVSGNLQLKISRVDNAELAALKANKVLNQNSGPLVASRGDVVSDNVSEQSMRWYRSFRDALNTKKLVNPPGESALHFYRLIESDNKQGSPFVDDLRRALISSLEASAQVVINRYMASDKKIRTKDVQNANLELKTALDLLPKTDIRYNTLHARQLFLENGFLFCICLGEESTLSQAQFALERLRQSLKIEPDAAYVLNSMGNVFFTRKNYDSAKYYYLKAAAAAPKWSYPLNNLGTLSVELNKNQEAVKYYEAALAIDPDFAHIYNNIGNSLPWSQYEKKIEYYNLAYKHDSANAATYLYNIGVVYLLGKKNLKPLATQYFDKIKGHPHAGYYYNEITKRYNELKDLPNVEKYSVITVDSYLDEIERSEKPAPLYAELASIYEDNDDPYSAKEYWQKAIEADSTEADYYIHLASASIADDMLIDVQRYLNKARALRAPQSFLLNYNLAESHRYTQPDSAIYFIRKAITLSEGVDQTKARVVLGRLLGDRAEELGTGEEAVREVEQAIANGYMPSASGYAEIAEWYMYAENWSRANAMADKALKLAGKYDYDWKGAYIIMARIATRQEKYDDAINFLRKAMQAPTLSATNVKTVPDFEALEDLPKYQALLRELEARK